MGTSSSDTATEATYLATSLENSDRKIVTKLVASMDETNGSVRVV